jgi:thiamine biosynthesis protein ThiI
LQGSFHPHVHTRDQLVKTQYDTLIVRLAGEIGIKSEWTRREYEKLLLKNLKKSLRYNNRSPEVIERTRGRIYIKTKDPTQMIQEVTRVFGISSVSPARQTISNQDDITKTAIEITQVALHDNSSFAVRCRRTGQHPYTSMDICRELGKQILMNLKTKNLSVNLTNPDQTLHVEVRDEQAYVYVDTIRGQGGFPLGSQARTVCLLSGGIDSPVACWLAMKRGSPTIPIYIDNAPYTDERAKEKAIETAKKLQQWTAGTPKKIYIVPNGENIEKIRKEAPEKFACLLCKRLMYRIAERIAEKEKAFGIITGEAIGEQASQTVHNLLVVDEAATRYPIHRPLLGFDKTETEAIARRIGTFEVSTKKAKDCSAAPCKPATRARLQVVKEAEGKLNTLEMVEKALQKTEIVTL